MIFHHILLDLVSDIFKGLQKGFKQNYFWTYFMQYKYLQASQNICMCLS